MLLSLMDDPNRIAVQGKIVWITPRRRAGQPHAGHRRPVHAGRDRRRRRSATIEKILGQTLASSRPTHTM